MRRDEVVRRWRWPGVVLAGLLGTCGVARGASPTLQGLGLRSAPDGQTVVLSLSAPAAARVEAVERSDGSLARLYVDLPPGSRVLPGARRLAAPAVPVTGARLGQADDGSVRVVLDLERARTWRMRREDGGRVVAVTVTRGRGTEPVRGGPRAAEPAAAPAAVPTVVTVPTAAAAPETPPSRADVAPDADAKATAAVPPSDPPAAAPVAPAPVAVASAGRSAVRRPAAARQRIVLDPGHGGSDPGAMGFVVEKELTLDLATRVATLLRERLDADVVLTRSEDVTLPLSARTQRANAEQADLFVSIHANANEGGTLQGIETYVLDDSADRATLRLASMENGLDMLHPGQGGETDLRYILSDLVQGGKMEESTALATAIQGQLVRGLRRNWTGVTDLGVKRGPFYVLVGAYMPCVLVEVSFLTHPVEGRRLADPAYRQAIAEGIAAGIVRFLADDARTRTL